MLKATPAKVNRSRAIELARVGCAGDLPALATQLHEIERAGDPGKRGTWEYFARRLRLWIQAGIQGETPFRIFQAKGNKKLPFFSFSSLPGFDCPGAGACLYKETTEFGTGFCYSFKSWRYPAAFLRQLQNSILLRFGTEQIKRAWQGIPDNKTVRLYVDGDFHSVEILRFWMELIRDRETVQVYGYSKSWNLFLALEKEKFSWPGNYVLNLSNGSRYGDKVRRQMEKLACVRGQFVAVPVSRKWIDSKAYQDKANAGSKEYRAEVLQALRALHPGEKHFACPGNCGNCLPGGIHACAFAKLNGVVIGIGIHE